MKKVPFIIFLDVDGVFNYQTFYKERYERWQRDGIPEEKIMEQHHINQFCIKRIEMFN